MRQLAYFAVFVLLCGLAAPASAYEGIADLVTPAHGEGSFFPSPSTEDVGELEVWFGAWLATGDLPDVEGTDWTVAARDALVSRLYELEEFLHTGDVVVARLRSGREALPESERRLMSREENERGLRASANTLVLELAAAASEAEPSDARRAALLEDAFRTTAAALASASSERLSAARAFDSLSNSVLESEELLGSFAERRSELSTELHAMAYELALYMREGAAAAEPIAPLSDILCPFYAPPGTIRPDGASVGPVRSSDGASAEEAEEAFGAQGSEDTAGSGPGWHPVFELCLRSSASARGPAAAAAVRYAFNVLGAPYACDGVGRSDAFRYDCSSFTSRAYSEAGGMSMTTSSWAPSTRDMVPWGGHRLSAWFMPLAEGEVVPGDLWLFDTGLSSSRHVVMILADGLMVHTNRCGDVLHVTASWADTTPDGVVRLGARAVVASDVQPGGEDVDDAVGEDWRLGEFREYGSLGSE